MSPNEIRKRSLRIPQLVELRSWFHSNRLAFVISVFSGLAIINTLTALAGIQRVYSLLNSHVYTAFLSFVIYDSPGTVAGLFGVVVIYALISLFFFLISGQVTRRRAFFFVFTSFVAGVASQAYWSSCCSGGGGFPAGSSAIDFAALACLIVYSIVDAVHLLRIKADRRSRLWTDSKLTALYFFVVAGLLTLYAISIQPIYLPTLRFNWRVHEYAFLSAFVVSLITEILNFVHAKY